MQILARIRYLFSIFIGCVLITLFTIEKWLLSFSKNIFILI